MAKMTRPRAMALSNPSAMAVVEQLERLQATEVEIARKRDADTAVLINAQHETNRLLAAMLVRMGGQP